MTPLDEFKNFPFDWKKLNSSHKGKMFRTYFKEVICTESCIKPVLEYLLRDHSASQTAKIIGDILNWKWAAGSVISLAKSFGIKTRGCAEAANFPECRRQHEITNLQRYGAVNTFCKGTTTYEKKVRTVQKRYGVDNIRKSKEFQKIRKKSMLAKYGVTNAIFLPTYERCTGRRSKLQQKVEKVLDELGVEYEYEVPNMFQKYNETLQREYNPIVDILVESRKVVIEVNGDKWHANPRMYKASDIIVRWDGNVTAKHIWDVDVARTQQIESFGYKVIVVWERDTFDLEQVKEYLRTELNLDN